MDSDSRRNKWWWPLLFFALLGAALTAAPAGAATYPAGFEERTLVSGLTGPVGVAWTPDGRMLVIEKAGRLKIVNPGGSTATTALDLTGRVNSYWDRGLLGIAVDSDFAANRFVYLLYTHDLNQLTPDGSGTAISRLSRFELSATNQLSNETVLLGTYTGGACPAPSNTVDCIPSEGASHSIGSVRSAPDGTLYVGSGDASSFSFVDSLAFRTYNEQSMAGKILRIDRNGRGVPGHPFCPTNTNLDHVCTKVYAKGFRNPYRFKLRPGGGLAVGDVGWDTREEVSLIGAGGRSYGWPCYEGTVRTPGYRDRSECAAEYAREGTPGAHVAPAHDYAHNGASAAVMAGPTYQGSEYPPGYRDTIFFGDYAAGFLRRLRLGPNGAVAGVENFATGWTGTDIEAAPNGDVTFVSFGDGSPGTGAVRRIAYSPGNGTPTANASGTPTSGDAPLAVQFSSAGSADPDGDQLGYTWDFGDGSTSTSANPSHTYASQGVFEATLAVSDGRGRSNTDSVQISVGGDSPVATIETPVDESRYRDGDTITLRGSATDGDDGTLPAARLRWNVILFHGSHIHQVGDFEGVAQASFEALRDHDSDSYYEITLRATDSDGLVGTRTIQIRPETVPLSLRSEPAGAPLSYGGAAVAAPFDHSAAIGFRTTVSSAEGFTSDGRPFVFDGWSDGGARSRELTVPAAATTLTARYLENKSLGRPATASTTEAGSDPRNAVDGDGTTRWGSAYADDQWWQVDLGSARQVSAVELDWEAAYASSYEILTSLDGVNFSPAQQVALLGPGTHRASFAARAARYVRVRSLQRATLFGISFWEGRVLGPPDGPPPPSTDLALSKPASASSSHPSAGAPGAANDGNSATRWSSTFADGQWWQVDLGAVKAVDRVEVNWEAAYASAYRIQTSTDGTTFTTAASVTRSGPGLEATTFAARDARYVRLVADTRGTAYGISFWDFRVFGTSSPPPPDTDPPETTITSGPSGATTATSASFEFSSDEAGSSFECRLDAGAWSACSSPKAYGSLGTGQHSFDVRATDPAGNVEAEPASRTWTVEAPTGHTDLALNRPASASSTDGSGGAPGAANDGNSATRWSSTFADGQWWQVDLGAVKTVDRVEVNWEAAYASAYRIQTSTDGTTFTNAASVTRAAPGLAATTFAARDARYVRLIADTRATVYGISFWDVRVFGTSSPPPPDTDPPDTTITSGPSGTTTATSAAFEFSSDEAGSSFECRLDIGPWAACSSPRTYSSLGVGQHTFEVRATDPAGNVESDSASRTWTVEAPTGQTDLALNRPVSASSTDGSAGAPGAANDGNSATRWSSTFADGQWWQVDLGAVKTVDRVEVNWEAAYASAYRIQTSTDGTTFTNAASVTLAAPGVAATTFAARDARYVRLVADTRATAYGISFWDFRVFGTGSTPPAQPPPRAYAETVRTTAGLRHWWRLGDGATSALDSRSTNHGTFAGGSLRVGGLVAGDADGAHDFDGVNDYVNLVPGPFGAPARFSVEAWVRIDAQKASSGQHFLVTDSFDDLGADGFVLSVNAANRPQLYIARTAATRVTATSSQALVPGTIYHLVGTYDGQRARVYVNGVERASAAYTGGITWHASRDLLLGRQRKTSQGAARWLDGTLDEVALYDVALAGATVHSHYDSGR